MWLFSRLIVTVVALGYLSGPGVRCIVAQSHPSPSELFQKLQSDQTTDSARDELLRLGKLDPEVREYLAIHLPSLIESGPGRGPCSGYPCQEWKNAVELAGNLRIGEAAPALARWINWRSPGPAGLSLEARLVFYPAARALFEIGDPAIPSVRFALDHGGPDEHYRAVRVLCIIHTPEAKAALRDFLPRESDPNLQAMIKSCLGK
jgi:hypothetical protein